MDVKNLKQNNTAKAGNILFLTKPLGVGILTTAEKKGILKPEHIGLAAKQMMQLNKIGEVIGNVAGVTAMTDVTGFGLLGHLTEMAEGSGLSAEVDFEKIPFITPDIKYYIDNNSIPGGTNRNWDSYGNKIGEITDFQKAILADPQTSGGLLFAVEENAVEEIKGLLKNNGLENFINPIGRLIKQAEKTVSIIN